MQHQFIDLKPLADGLTWPESPRWCDGELWFSDVHNFRLMKIDREGRLHKVVDVPGRPAGLGFMPGGRLLLASALDHKLWWVEGDSLTLAADLSGLVTGLLNDMVVDAKGRAWVGDTGFDLAKGGPERLGCLISWTAEEGAKVAATETLFPNGLAISADGGTLYLAETFGNCVSAFDVSADGKLSNRRTHVELEGRPDGLCLDRDGGLWVPLLWQQELHYIAADGQIIQRIRFPTERVISCVLAGEDRRTLYIGSAEIDESDKTNIRRHGLLRTLRVKVPGVGIP